jgi:acetyl esterase/lipase
MKPLMRMLARAALNRPDAALIKASGGVARTVRGRTLDPRFQFIEHQARSRPQPAEPSVEAARAATRDLTYFFGGKPEPGVSWSAETIPAPDRAIAMRAYRPKDQDRSAPLMVFLHFGGGVVGDLDTCHAFCTILAREIKAPVLSIDYRLAPEHRFPAGLEDCIVAYRWALDNAERFGAPKGRAAIGGDSMGGHYGAIIAQEAVRQGFAAPVVQLLIYPAVDLADASPSMTDFADAFPLTRETMAWFMSQYLPAGVDMNDPRLNPAGEKELARLAPALVYTAGFDPLADQGAAYAERLREAGRLVVFRCYESLAHGFTAFTGAAPAADAACREMARETARAMRA